MLLSARTTRDPVRCCYASSVVETLSVAISAIWPSRSGKSSSYRRRSCRREPSPAAVVRLERYANDDQVAVAHAPSTVAARAKGPSSETRSASVWGPRELLRITLRPAAVASRATWPLIETTSNEADSFQHVLSQDLGRVMRYAHQRGGWGISSSGAR